MKTLRTLPIFNSQLTKREKLEYALIAVAGIIMAAVGVYTFMPVYAEMKPAELAKLIRTIIRVICFIVGALFMIVGIVKFAISHANEDGPAQQKSIMMMATGVVLIVLGGMANTLVQDSWFEVTAS